MRRLFTMVALGALVTACGGKETETDSDVPDPGCTNAILDTFPADTVADVYYRTAIRFTLAEEDQAATIEVADSGGAAVAGSTTIEGTVVTFTPSAPLTPTSDYAVTLTYDCGQATVNWTTSDVGAAVAETTLPGSTYSLDLASGNFVQPAGVGPLIQQQLDAEVLISVDSATATEIEMSGAIGDGGGSQDLCAPTIDFPVAADFSENPFFSVGPDTIALSIEGFDVIIDEMIISGAFSPASDKIDGAVLAGGIDTRPLVELVAPGGDDNAVCDLVATFLVNCEPCEDGSGDFCLTVYVDNMAADIVPGLVLVPRTQAEVDADPLCQ